MDKKSDIGLIGLAVMGENLALNIESKGFTVSIYNRTISKVDNLTEGRAKGKNIIGTSRLNAYCKKHQQRNCFEFHYGRPQYSNNFYETESIQESKLILYYY